MAKKILIADDEPNIVISLEFLLRREGYEVVVAQDGAEALAQVRAERPDMAILDVMMPHRNGFEVCQDPVSYTHLDVYKRQGKEGSIRQGFHGRGRQYRRCRHCLR